MKILLETNDIVAKLKSALAEDGLEIDGDITWGREDGAPQASFKVSSCTPPSTKVFLEAELVEKNTLIRNELISISAALIDCLAALETSQNSGEALGKIQRSLTSIHKKLGDHKASPKEAPAEPLDEETESWGEPKAPALKSISPKEYEEKKKLREERLAEIREKIKEEAEEVKESRRPSEILKPSR